MTKYPELWNALIAEFPESCHKKRLADKKTGFFVTYITARSVANRLDDVLGFENWWDEYEPCPLTCDGNVICRLSIRLPDGSILTKQDVGTPSELDDVGTNDKGAFSEALKRAAAKFGIARYLYGEGVYQAPEKAALSMTLPPAATENTSKAEKKRPKVGKELIPWILKGEKETGLSLLSDLIEWGIQNDFPDGPDLYSPAQTQMAVAEVLRAVAAAQKKKDKNPHAA